MTTIVKALGELPDRVDEGIVQASGSFLKFDVLEIETDAIDLASTATLLSAFSTIADATGVSVGDAVLAVVPQGASSDAIFTPGVFMTGQVGDTDEVTIVMTNRSAGTVDPASQTFKIFVMKLAVP